MSRHRVWRIQFTDGLHSGFTGIILKPTWREAMHAVGYWSRSLWSPEKHTKVYRVLDQGTGV